MSDAPARVALVTGANRGLGFETARPLLWKGLSAILAGRDASALERARRSLNEVDQRHATTAMMDITSVESISTAHQALITRLGRVDVLVNSAAVLLGENDVLFSIAADDYRRTFEANRFGVIEVCAFVPGMAAPDTAAWSTCHRARANTPRCPRTRRRTQSRSQR